VTDNALRGAGVSGFGSSVFAHRGDGSGALHMGHGAHEQGWSEHGSVVSDAQQRTSSPSRPHACTQPSAASGINTLTHSASTHRTHRRNGRLGIPKRMIPQHCRARWGVKSPPRALGRRGCKGRRTYPPALL